MKPRPLPLLLLALILAACSGTVPSEPRTFGDDLHDAAEDGDIAEIRSLLKQGADVNAYDPDEGETPLNIAVRNRRYNAVEALLLGGADPNLRSAGNTALHLAAEIGDVEMTRILLDHGANPEIRNRDNKTPMEVAVEKGHTQYFYYLQNEVQSRK